MRYYKLYGINLRTKWEHVPEIRKPILHIKNRQEVEGYNVADQYEFVGTIRYAYKSEPGAYRYSMFSLSFQRISFYESFLRPDMRAATRQIPIWIAWKNATDSKLSKMEKKFKYDSDE